MTSKPWQRWPEWLPILGGAWLFVTPVSGSSGRTHNRKRDPR
jgi:hypothetical protein